MIAHFIQVAIPVFLIVISSIISTLFMGVKLTQSEFGDFALLKTFILIGSTFSILGIDNYYIRYGHENKSKIRHLHIILLTAILSAVFIILMSILYDLGIEKAVLLWIILFANSNLLYFSSVLRIKLKLFLSKLMYNSWKILLFGFLLIILWDESHLSIVNLYYYLALTLLITSGLVTYIFLNRLKSNIQEENSLLFSLKKSLSFWKINIFTLLFTGLDILIIPLIIDKSNLGSYHAVTFIYLTGFSLLGSIVAFVLFPYISQNKLVNWNAVFSILLFCVSILIICLFIFAQDILTLAYASKYANIINHYIIILLIVFGILQMAHVLSHFYIYAKASQHELSIYFKLVLGSCLLFIISFFITSHLIEYTIFSIICHILIVWIIKYSLMVHLIKNINKESSVNNFDILYNNLDL